VNHRRPYAGLFLIPLVLLASFSYESGAAESSPRYTFSWPLNSGPAPRGGTTQGAPVNVESEPSPAWQQLQTPGLSLLERDRQAILAMAGAYRVAFDFLEVMTFTSAERPAPYQSWGTERVFVDADRGAFISLVHILEMRFLNPDGSVSEPMVTKHWRQEWTYEPADIVEYAGRDQWRRRKTNAHERKGAWSQTVYQVDESPRYASIGRWQHTPAFSTWISGDTWRPLPRREWSVRDDYQVLEGTNRHTIQPRGWTQEENNLKTVLTAQRTVDSTKPYVAREYGVARYEHISADFDAAERYYASTKRFWNRVRDEWTQLFAKQGVVTLRGPVDKLGLFQPLFERADAIAEGAAQTDADAALIHDTLSKMGAYH